MARFTGLCSIPIEMDESMNIMELVSKLKEQECSSFGLDDACRADGGWPSPGMKELTSPESTSCSQRYEGRAYGGVQWMGTDRSCCPVHSQTPGRQVAYSDTPRLSHVPARASLDPGGLRLQPCGVGDPEGDAKSIPPLGEGGVSGRSGQNRPENLPSKDTGYESHVQKEQDELDPPLPLRSDIGYTMAPQGRYNNRSGCGPYMPPPDVCPMGCRCLYSPRCPELPRGDMDPRLFMHQHKQPVGHAHLPGHHPASQVDVGHWRGPEVWPGNPEAECAVNVPYYEAPPLEVMSEVSVRPSPLQPRGPAEAQGKRKTISLPDECRNVFVTYSVDSASEIVPFVEFLTNQGFRPAIDIFDNQVRSMDINNWMDSYLKDKSVLIIIVISPQYKADIEGSGLDEHGLHTKYIHSMMQNEFIQQGSLNFRFIPVLFPNATQKHVPGWLQNTRVYRWPRDLEDLLLRLLREERYIPPPLAKEVTLTIRPVTADRPNTM
ncbi:adapter protein CIKS [Megalops cyprinoides]|uniref:adapter protein CIKS n=1 Tax=Megalops cyprinoides TaxID=118141 RepID=UPI0018653A00|nr:adapter protein CIKS [Megalops cyprinoides]XP_036398905.1 adapter protein CIKS [Megalops cyprinoides]